MKANFILLIAISNLLLGCSLALPLAGAGSAVRSEVRVQEIEHRLESNEKIIDYLLEQHPDI